MSRAYWDSLDRERRTTAKQIVLETVWAIGAVCLVTGLILIGVAVATT